MKRKDRNIKNNKKMELKDLIIIIIIISLYKVVVTVCLFVIELLGFWR